MTRHQRVILCALRALGGRRVAGIDLADMVGTSQGTIRVQVFRLREAGYAVHSKPGCGGGYWLELPAGGAA